MNKSQLLSRVSSTITESRVRELLDAAISEAARGAGAGDGGPFGALVISADGEVIALAHNEVLKQNDPTCHAETLAIRRACQKLGRPHLDGCIVLASSEPCPMCLTVGYWAKVKAMIFVSPVSVAAAVGFSDQFIYDELAKPVGERELSVFQWPDMQEDGQLVFAKWQENQGKLY